MKTDHLSLFNEIRLLRIIFFVLLLTQAAFFIIAFFLKDSFEPDKEIKEVFDYLIPLLLIGAIFLSRYLYRNVISKSRRFSFDKKVNTYKSAVIISLAVLEGANMVSMIAFMLTGEYLYAGASLIVFLLFILRAPTDDKFKTDLELTPDELSFME